MHIFILFYLFLRTDTYVKVSIRQPQCLDTVVYPLFLMQESRDAFVVVIEIISSHDDVFDSNIKIFR